MPLIEFAPVSATGPHLTGVCTAFVCVVAEQVARDGADSLDES